MKLQLKQRGVADLSSFVVGLSIRIHAVLIHVESVVSYIDGVV